MKQVEGKVVVGIVVFGSWLLSQPIYLQILRRQCCLGEVEANEVIWKGKVVVGIVVGKGAYRNLLRATTKLLRKETSK